MLDYPTTMKIGQSRYQDVLDLLQAQGLGATFTQTGGMCAALEVLLDSGHTLLVTDAEDTLAWDREEHRGWGVGLYPPDQANAVLRRRCLHPLGTAAACQPPARGEVSAPGPTVLSDAQGDA